MTRVKVRQNYGLCRSSADLVVDKVIRRQNSKQNMNCDKLFRRSDNNMEEFSLIETNGRKLIALVKFKIFPLLRAGLLLKYN